MNDKCTFSRANGPKLSAEKILSIDHPNKPHITRQASINLLDKIIEND